MKAKNIDYHVMFSEEHVMHKYIHFLIYLLDEIALEGDILASDVRN